MKLIELLNTLCELKLNHPETNIPVVIGYENNFENALPPHHIQLSDTIVIAEDDTESSVPFQLWSLIKFLEDYDLSTRNAEVEAYFNCTHCPVTAVVYDEVLEHIRLALEEEEVKEEAPLPTPINENNNKTTASSTLAELQQRVERLEACHFNIHSPEHKEMLNRYLDAFLCTWPNSPW